MQVTRLWESSPAVGVGTSFVNTSDVLLWTDPADTGVPVTDRSRRGRLTPVILRARSARATGSRRPMQKHEEGQPRDDDRQHSSLDGRPRYQRPHAARPARGLGGRGGRAHAAGRGPLDRRLRGRVRPARRPSSWRRAPSSSSTRSPTRTGAPPTPSDVARVEDRTFICSVDEADAGPTNNWMDPGEMKAIMTDLYRGSHARPDDVRHPVRAWARSTPRPRCSASRSPTAAYVVVSMRIMARIGTDVLEAMGEDADVRALPALARRAARAGPGRRRRGRATRRSTSPSSPRRGRSGRTAPATAATPCSARSATRCASPASWPATRAGSPSTC